MKENEQNTSYEIPKEEYANPNHALILFGRIPSLEPGMVFHDYNPNTWEARAGGSRVQGQPRICRKPCLKKKINPYIHT